MIRTAVWMFMAALTVAPLFAAAEAPVAKKIVIRNGELISGDKDVVVVRPGETFFGGTFLGIGTVTLSKDLRAHFGVADDAGVMVSEVTADSPAAKAGLRAGDIITSFDGRKVESTGELGRMIREKEKGNQVRIDFRRNGVNQHVFATLGEREGIRIPEINIDVPAIKWNPKAIEAPLVIGGETIDRLEKYFESPEWKAKMESLGDCSRVQARVRELEKRLQDLEKRLSEK